MKVDLKKILLDISDNNEDILRDDINLIEDGYIDSYAFIELFEALEDEGVEISPTELKKEDLKNYKSLNNAIEKYIENEESIDTIFEKIPDIKIPEAYYEHDFISSPLVEITSDTGIIVEMQYPLLKMENAIDKCLVRKEVKDKLLEAKSYLPDGLTFKIWDAYRPMALQEELYYKYKEDIIKEFELEDLDEEKKNEIINSYVALPSKDENFPPQHTTGGAVDITLAYIDTKEALDLGIPFDSFSRLTNTNAFEKKGMNEEIRNNRRILYGAMTKAGFTNLPSECWHFDYGNRNWAYYNKKPAMYKGIFELKKEL